MARRALGRGGRRSGECAGTDACVCYLVSLVLVLLEAKKTRRSKNKDEMR